MAEFLTKEQLDRLGIRSQEVKAAARDRAEAVREDAQRPRLNFMFDDAIIQQAQDLLDKA
jgi:outer membrane usher protein FimD/PapC